MASKKNHTQLAFLAVLAAPSLVIILTLWLGITVVYVPQMTAGIYESGVVNIRYGLATLPFVAILIGYLVGMYPKMIFAVFGICVAQMGYFYQTNSVYTITDAKVGYELSKNHGYQEIASNIATACSGKTIMSAGMFDPLFFYSHLHLNHFINEGSYQHWSEALKSPESFADCVVMAADDADGDVVRKTLLDDPMFLVHYELISRMPKVWLFVKRDALVLQP